MANMTQFVIKYINIKIINTGIYCKKFLMFNKKNLNISDPSTVPQSAQLLHTENRPKKKIQNQIKFFLPDLQNYAVYRSSVPCLNTYSRSLYIVVLYVRIDLHIDSSIIALDAKATDNTPTDPKGEGEKNADWARRMDLFLGTPDNHHHRSGFRRHRTRIRF